jgi:hypothetical protein
MKQSLRVFMCILLFGAVCCVVLGFSRGPMNKWLSSAGLMFDIAGIIQLDIGGLWEKVMEMYGDVSKYPGGPPSNITRQIIDDPDRPIRTWLRNTLFFETRTGFRLIVIGFFFQLAGTWAW